MIQAANEEYDKLQNLVNKIWPHLKVFWLSYNNPTGQCKKKKKTENEVGMDRDGLYWQHKGAENRTKWKEVFASHLCCPNDLTRLWGILN